MSTTAQHNFKSPHARIRHLKERLVILGRLKHELRARTVLDKVIFEEAAATVELERLERKEKADG